jgi:hypothetical protein
MYYPAEVDAASSQPPMRTTDTGEGRNLFQDNSEFRHELPLFTDGRSRL